jgi:tetratricopeptide (TPR) repeat protein
MPAFTRIQVHYHTPQQRYVPVLRAREHRIGIYPAAKQEVMLAWLRRQPDAPSREAVARLTKELLDHWLGEAARYRAEHRYLAALGALHEARRIEAAPAVVQQLRDVEALQLKIDRAVFQGLQQSQERRLPEAIAILKEVLALQPGAAKAHAKLGALYAADRQPKLAVEHLEAVSQCDPDDASGYAMLGWLAYLEDRAEAAAQAYGQADAVEPWNADVNHRWGLALMKLGRWEQAETRFRHALTIDPKHAGSCQGLAHVLRQQGEPAEAVRYARRAAKLTQFENADVLLTLADAYADAGSLAQAQTTLSQALKLAQAGNPQLVPQLRRRMEEYRLR